MDGLWFRFLEVDLCRQTSSEFEIPSSWGDLHLGGRGLGARYLLEERRALGRTPEAFSAEASLLFVVGPLQGLGLPGVGKHVVMGWSPRTGTVNESYAGGAFGYELARSGYDGLVLRGAADQPCYLHIGPDGVHFESASGLWGMKTGECEQQLRQRYGDSVAVATIGPAGERLVRMACILHDGGHAAGRPGFGAVMGSKQVKAIVVQGSKDRPVADRQALRTAAREFTQLTLDNPGIKGFMEYGTSQGVMFYDELGILPTRNFQRGAFSGADRISAQAINERLLVRREGCRGCAVRCRPIVRTRGIEAEGPEYETLAAFGSLCLVDDLESVALAHHRANQYGIDAISAGVCAAWLMEASERGLIPEEERVAWGDAEAMLRVLDRIALREGIGDLLAEGLENAAPRWHGEPFAVHVRGVELPMHDPRGKRGLAISYATSPRGATHLEAMHDEMFEGPGAPMPEIGVFHPADRMSWHDKPRMCKQYEDLYSFVDSAIICGFVSWNQSPAGPHNPFPLIRKCMEAVTGREMDAMEMMRIGERNYLIRRVITALDGHCREADRLPIRLLEPLQGGVCDGASIAPQMLADAVEEYYALRGMDRKGPSDERLRSLDLGDVAGLIPREGKPSMGGGHT